MTFSEPQSGTGTLLPSVIKLIAYEKSVFVPIKLIALVLLFTFFEQLTLGTCYKPLAYSSLLN